MWQISYDDRVAGDLKKLDTTILRQIKSAIESKLSKHPMVFGKPLRYPLVGLWSLRVGEYRIIYTASAETVFVIVIDKRERVYPEAARRLK